MWIGFCQENLIPKRFCNREFTGDSGAHTLFADGYPVLVTNAASLSHLNTQIETPLPMARFRPNIVLSGLEPYDEDHIAAIHMGDVSLRFVKPCVRCQITTTDQDTGQVGAEPLATLRGFRMNERLGGVAFGVNAIIVAGEGRTLSKGMDAEIAYAF